MGLSLNRDAADGKGHYRIRLLALSMTALLCVTAICTQAFGAVIEGSGQMDSAVHPDPPNFSEDFSDPIQVLASRSVQTLLPTPFPGAPSLLQQYSGYATYGRISTRSLVVSELANADPSMLMPVEANAVLGLGSEDEITIANAGPSDFLQLDVSLSGYLRRRDFNIGNHAVAGFSVRTWDPENTEVDPINVFEVRFNWVGLLEMEPHVATSSDYGDSNFIAFPGEELAFSPTIGPNEEHGFGGRGYVRIPLFDLDANPVDTFKLELTAFSSTTCASNSTSTCRAESNFGNTALIGNAQIVDAAGDVVPAASFTSVSGYDYITPPSAVPLPGALGLMLLGLPALGMMLTRPRAEITIT